MKTRGSIFDDEAKEKIVNGFINLLVGEKADWGYIFELDKAMKKMGYDYFFEDLIEKIKEDIDEGVIDLRGIDPVEIAYELIKEKAVENTPSTIDIDNVINSLNYDDYFGRSIEIDEKVKDEFDLVLSEGAKDFIMEIVKPEYDNISIYSNYIVSTLSFIEDNVQANFDSLLVEIEGFIDNHIDNPDFSKKDFALLLEGAKRWFADFMSGVQDELKDYPYLRLFYSIAYSLSIKDYLRNFVEKFNEKIEEIKQEKGLSQEEKRKMKR